MQNMIFTPLLCHAEPSFDHLCKRRSTNEYIIIIININIHNIFWDLKSRYKTWLPIDLSNNQ